MTSLKQANEALRQKNYEAAIGLYVRALQQPDALPHVIQNNLKLTQDRYLQSRMDAKPRVCICGWNLAQNPAGRVATLALLYQPLVEVQIIGCFFKQLGFKTWAPLTNFPIPMFGIQIQDESRFIAQAVEMVLQHPCDLLHLSKPRFPNIIIGALYKLIWNAHVIVDIDDEELAFVNATEPLALDTYIKAAHNSIKLSDLTGETFTRLAVGMSKSFDGITAVNPALQKRYGGELVRHARDENQFVPSDRQRRKSREKHGFAATEKVILFLGTPRQHKGLLETANTIGSLKRKDVVFLIVGDFPAPLQGLRNEIQAIPGLKTRFLGDQPFETISDILALGDLCILLQDPDHLAAQYQTPAKLTDALAMGIPVLAEKTPGLADLAENKAFTVVTRATLASAIDTALKAPTQNAQSHPVYRELLTFAANSQPLSHILTNIRNRTRTTLPLLLPLRRLLECLPLCPALLPQSSEPANTSSLELKPSQDSSTTYREQPGRAYLLSVASHGLPVATAIKKAAGAMEQGDWNGAYDCWKSLLHRPIDVLNVDTLLRVSRELFALDAFTDASVALKQAAAKDPNHPGVLCEQAQQYYYHCYSSWLMLATENEPDWYKVDGLEERPDWQIACTLIEMAEIAVPRNNLRRYVQAYLLLAEEAWDTQQRKLAHSALRTALNAIGPKKLDDELANAIFQAVDQLRDGKVNAKDPYYQSLQQKLKALQPDLLPVQDWLSLNDILNWNGLLLCGYVAREKGVDLAISQGKAHPNKREIVKTALKAALDRNDTKLADAFLAQLTQISIDAVDAGELASCCELMKGNLEGFRRKWPHPPTSAEKLLNEYLKDKSVAAIGPAPTGGLEECEIDSFDVVVRNNQRTKASDRFASKDSLTIFNAHTIRLLKSKNEKCVQAHSSYLYVRRESINVKPIISNKTKIVVIKDYPATFYKSQNSFQSIVMDLLRRDLCGITIANINFFTTAHTHTEAYRNRSSANEDGMRGIQTVIANHDLVSQFNFIKYLVSVGAVNATSKILYLISEDVESYLKRIISQKISRETLIAPPATVASKPIKKPPASKFNYHQFSNLLEAGDTKSVLDCIGNHGSKMKRALDYEKVWPYFETSRELSPPDIGVAFYTVATIKFIPGLEALILCLIDLYPGMTNDFYVCHDGSITEFAIKRLHNFYPNFIFTSKDPSKYDLSFTDEVNHQRVGSLGYLNLEALQLDQYRRVVILDSDILILKDISQLWDQGCEKPRVVMDAGIRPFGIVSRYTEKLIFNSGVISLPQKFIKNSSYSRAIKFLSRMDECTCDILNSYADQKFWNLFLADADVLYLPLNYNCIKTILEKFYPTQLANTAILHFTGAKPWFLYSSKDEVNENDLISAKAAKKEHPLTFSVWENRITELMCKYRRRSFLAHMSEFLKSTKDTLDGKKCLLIGNGPSLQKTDLNSIHADVKICFNWFVHHKDFDKIKPDHYVLPSHQFFGGWYSYSPSFPDGFLEALLQHKHKPVIWVSYYFKEYIETMPELSDFKIQYFLFEKPYKFHSDQVGWMGIDIADFLTDNRTGILSVGVPLAVHFGVSTIELVGCDSNYSASKDDYFYDGALHTSKSTNSKNLIDTWSDKGPGFRCYKIAEDQLRVRGVRLIDSTVGGRLKINA